MKCYH